MTRFAKLLSVIGLSSVYVMQGACNLIPTQSISILPKNWNSLQDILKALGLVK